MRDLTTRSPRPPHFRRSLLEGLWRWAAVPALALFAAAPASAYCSSQVEWMNFPQISVASDGNHYTGVTAVGYGWEGRMTIECSGLARVKSWHLYPEIVVAGLEPLSFELYKDGRSYPFGQRPQNVHRTVGQIFPNVFVNDYARSACNLNLDLLMSQGYSRAQVLAQDRAIALEVRAEWNVDITVGDSIDQYFSPDHTEIVCQKSPAGPTPPRPAGGGLATSGDFELDSAKLTIFPNTYSGACPKDLTLFMKVEGNHNDTFEARIESTAGWTSTKMVHATDEFSSGSGLWGKDFSQPFTVPVEMPTGGGGGGGGGVPPASGSFQVQQNPGDDVPVGPSTPPAGGSGFAAVDPGSNVHQQSLRLVATANGKTVASPWRQYRVTCDPRRAIDAATQQLQVGGSGPQPPKPPTPTPNPSPTPTPRPDGPKPAPASPSARPLPPAGAKSAPAASQPSKAKTRKTKKATSTPETTGSPAPVDAAPPATPTRATPAPKASQAAPKAAGLPDLRVSAARRSAKNPRAVEFLVENDGQATAAASRALLTCAGAAGGGESWSVAVPALPASSRRWVSSTPQRARPVRTAARGCEVRLDAGESVVESDESNNRFVCGDCAPAPARKR